MFDWNYFLSSLFTPSEQFLQGLALTIIVSVVSMITALILGLVSALMGRSRFVVFKILSSLFIWIFRGTPLLVQLVVIYTGFAAIGIFRFEDADVFGIVIKSAVQAAIVTLTLHEGAYISEIVRSGLEAVDKGQNEAALSLGMTQMGAMRRVIVPQAIRTMVPPLGNNFNGLMKSTSILSIIGVSEMFQTGNLMASATFKVFEIYLVVAIYYLLLTTIWTFIQAAIENYFNDKVGLPRAESVWRRLFGVRTKKEPKVSTATPPSALIATGGE